MAPTVKGLNPPQPTPAPQQPDLSKIPAVPAPGGEVSNFDNPDNKITATLVLISVCLAIMTIMMLVRIYTRTVVKKSMGLDDCQCLSCLDEWLLTNGLRSGACSLGRVPTGTLSCHDGLILFS